MALSKKVAAEFIGTFWLVFGGCGAAVLDAAFPQLGIGFLGVAFAFGLTVMTMVYCIGHISGAHLNPAVSVGLVLGKRFPVAELIPYVVAQVLGGILASTVLYVIASGKDGFQLSSGFASNGYGLHSPGGYSLSACFVAEVVLTFMFVLIIHGATDRRAPAGFAGIAIGPWSDTHSPCGYSCHEYFGKSGAQHGSCDFCGRLGNPPIVALLAGTLSWWRHRRVGVFRTA